MNDKNTVPSLIPIFLLGRQTLNKWFKMHGKYFKIGPRVGSSQRLFMGHCELADLEGTVSHCEETPG